MENYGSSESKDDKTSSKESSSGKPDATKAQSLAELLIHNDATEQHRMIWQREEKSKDDEDKDDSSSSKKIRLPLTEPKPKTTPAEKSEKPEAKAERADDSPESDDAALGELEPDEARAITEQYANGRGAELRDEQAQLPADSPEQAAATANAAMIQKLAEKLRAEPDGDPRRAIAEAADEVIREDDLGAAEPAEAALPIAETRPAEADDEPENTARRATNSTATPPPSGPPRHPFTPGYPGGPGGPGGINPNAAPTPNSPNSNPNTWGSANITPIEAQYYARQAENRGLLVGGIVGYLIGRRRGRIKAEKRLLPVQKKLEKEVTGLHDSIADRERQIRTLAARKARASQTGEAAALPAKLETAIPMPRPPEAVMSIERPPAPVSVEQPRHFEAVPIPNSEAQPTGSRPPESSPDQRIERLNQRELLKAAETVIIEGASLRQVYESRRITEKGLRHVMTEYLRGGDVKKALDQELTNKEMSYERDPQLRDNPSSTSSIKPGDGTGSVSSIQPRQPYDPEPTAPASSASRADTPGTSSSSSSAPNNLLQGTLMRAWVVLIVVLVVLATILLFR